MKIFEPKYPQGPTTKRYLMMQTMITVIMIPWSHLLSHQENNLLKLQISFVRPFPGEEKICSTTWAWELSQC